MNNPAYSLFIQQIIFYVKDLLKDISADLNQIHTNIQKHYLKKLNNLVVSRSYKRLTACLM
jgi:hypothetical protein